jgi:hypothetical protein
MLERAELVGGELDVSRPAGGGTLVRLRAPIRPVERSDAEDTRAAR